MGTDTSTLIADLLARHRKDLLKDWLEDLSEYAYRTGVISEAELRGQCSDLLQLIEQASRQGGVEAVGGKAWADTRTFLANISTSRAEQGFTPTETARFVFSLKQPLFKRLRAEQKDAEALADLTWQLTALIDQLGLYTFECYQKTREEVIQRQQEEMLELSTPVVKLWDGILALPLIGTLDSNRTQVVMESLLQRIVDTNSEVAIIDITGVPTVDTLVAQHLMKTVSAARLMGVECIISGIRPQIAQTIVHLGVALGDIQTKATLADAFRLALRRVGGNVNSSRDAAPRDTGR